MRAYAINEAGTGYGDEKTFVTVDPEEPGDEPKEPGDGDEDENEDPETPVDPEEPGDEPETSEQPEGAPVVTTAEVTEITVNSAVCRGGVSDGGGTAIIERGFCWNTEVKPTVLDFCVKDTESGLGNFTVEITDLDHNTQYYVRAYATNEVGTAYGEEVSFTTLATYSPVTGTSNGYGYVDLGLSVKWAICNVGATSPEEYGDYFAWGETTTKKTYYEDNCPTCGLSISELQAQGYIDSEGNLTAQYDTATANWGGDWRLPTYDELKELNTKCTWKWISTNDFKGYSVTGPNGNNIFLPVAGYRAGSSLIHAGRSGNFRSSTHSEEYDDSFAYYLFIDSDLHGLYGDYGCRSYGLSVRSILE